MSPPNPGGCLKAVADRNLSLARGAQTDGAIERPKHVAESTSLRVRKRGAGRSIGKGRGGIFVIQPVGDVEHLQSELNGMLVEHANVLADHQVRLPELRTADRIARQVPERAGLRRGERCR